MSQSLLKDGRIVDNSVIIDFDETHTNRVDALTPEEMARFVEQTLPDPPPPPVTVVTPRQARLALAAAGLLDQVNAAVAAADVATQISWEFATEINKGDPLIRTLGAGLGISAEQIDALFEAAAEL